PQRPHPHRRRSHLRGVPRAVGRGSGLLLLPRPGDEGAPPGGHRAVLGERGVLAQRRRDRRPPPGGAHPVTHRTDGSAGPGPEVSGTAKALPAWAGGLTEAELLARRPHLADLWTPFVAVDAAAVDHNIRLMQHWAATRGFHLMPHGKTTMAPELWRAQLAAGARGITLATPGQVRTVVRLGFDSLMLANELVRPRPCAGSPTPWRRSGSTSPAGRTRWPGWSGWRPRYGKRARRRLPHWRYAWNWARTASGPVRARCRRPSRSPSASSAPPSCAWPGWRGTRERSPTTGRLRHTRQSPLTWSGCSSCTDGSPISTTTAKSWSPPAAACTSTSSPTCSDRCSRNSPGRPGCCARAPTSSTTTASTPSSPHSPTANGRRRTFEPR